MTVFQLMTVLTFSYLTIFLIVASEIFSDMQEGMQFEISSISKVCFEYVDEL